jgi:hypothetical protein
MPGISEYAKEAFGADENLLLEALRASPNSRGYIIGAVSEVLLKRHLEALDYEVLRIAEKPSGGNLAKSEEARGDYYARKRESQDNAWLVIECKGLKSNSEFRGAKLDNADKVFRFLAALAFPVPEAKKVTFGKGLATYRKVKASWERKHRGRRFPPFRWDVATPGPVAADLQGIWRTKDDLRQWVNSLKPESFTEEAYRNRRGAVAILETHKPSRRKGPLTGITQAAPLVDDFSILAVDLYLRTGSHKFVFVNPKFISHSPTSPEHLYQNYVIDVLVPGRKDHLCINAPWFDDFEECVTKPPPSPRPKDDSQVDHRAD